MNIVAHPNVSLGGIRCPAIKGLAPETVAVLHKSLVHIVQIRQSIERTRFEIDRSWEAARESEELLRRLQLERF